VSVKKQKQLGHETVHPTVEEGKILNNGDESIGVDFTDKKLSPHAGSVAFWSFLHPRGFVGKLRELLPHRLPKSNNSIQPIDKAVAFVQGLLCGMEKLTQVAYLRPDPAVPAITRIKRVSSQSTLSRFFAEFDSVGKNQRCFGPLWEWCIRRSKARKKGYSLDFDSSRSPAIRTRSTFWAVSQLNQGFR